MIIFYNVKEEKSEIEFFKQTRTSKKNGGAFVNEAAQRIYVREPGVLVFHICLSIVLLLLLLYIYALGDHVLYKTGEDGWKKKEVQWI